MIIVINRLDFNVLAYIYIYNSLFPFLNHHHQSSFSHIIDHLSFLLNYSCIFVLKLLPILQISTNLCAQGCAIKAKVREPRQWRVCHLKKCCRTSSTLLEADTNKQHIGEDIPEWHSFITITIKLKRTHTLLP